MARVAQSSLVYLDTHVTVWLHDGLIELLSAPALEAIETAERLVISPMVELEIQYLHEIGRFRPTASEAINILSVDAGLQRSEVPFRQIVQTAMRINWTRDPFDRLIAAEAEATQGRLVSKDSTIRENSKLAVW
jgi:PIN domain nuclease of toxin-antitoxin system